MAKSSLGAPFGTKIGTNYAILVLSALFLDRCVFYEFVLCNLAPMRVDGMGKAELVPVASMFVFSGFGPSRGSKGSRPSCTLCRPRPSPTSTLTTVLGFLVSLITNIPQFSCARYGWRWHECSFVRRAPRPGPSGLVQHLPRRQNLLSWNDLLE